MKSRIIIIVVVVCMIAGILYLQYGRDVEVTSTMNTALGNRYEMDLTLVVNRLIITDWEQYAKELIQRCIDNNFHEVRFSYDMMGYPNGLRIRVYLNKLCEQSFLFCYRVKTESSPDYNIEDNPDKVEVFIDYEYNNMRK